MGKFWIVFDEFIYRLIHRLSGQPKAIKIIHSYYVYISVQV